MPPQINAATERSGHDSRTEVLTRAGWKLLSVVSKNDELATVDPLTAELTYERPTELIRFYYRGAVITGCHKHINFQVTPNHRLLIRHWDEQLRTLSTDYQFRDAKSLGWYCGLLTHVEWKGSAGSSDAYVVAGIDTHHKAQREDLSLPMSAWLRFLGIYLAEGTLVPVYNKEHRIQIAAVKQRERCFVIDTLRSIGIETSHNIKDRFSFSNHRLYEGMKVLGLAGVHAPDKFVPQFVFEQSACNVREFLLGHFSGDGADNGSGVRRHYTSSKQLAEDLQGFVQIYPRSQGLHIYSKVPTFFGGPPPGSGHAVHYAHEEEHAIDVIQAQAV
jgi:intein/homing endonuclease